MACALGACDAFDSSRLRPFEAEQPPEDSGNPDGSVGDGGDGDGGGEGGMCMPGPELCNGVDEDCDGMSDTQDEDARTACEAVVMNALTDCARVGGGARCVLRECFPGFDSCDGNPANGCEAPFCECNPCPDDDSGVDDDAGSL